MFCALKKYSISMSLVLAVTACGANTSLKWTEDVKLSNGRVVMLTRYQEFKGPHELGESPSVSDYWLEFKNPETGESVRWESNRSLGVVALMLDKSVPVLLARPEFGEWGKRNCPIPPYLLFRYMNGKWSAVDISGIPDKVVAPNLTIDPDTDRKKISGSNFHLTAEQTQNQLYSGISRYVINFSGVQGQTFGIDNCNNRLSIEKRYLIQKLK